MHTNKVGGAALLLVVRLLGVVTNIGLKHGDRECRDRDTYAATPRYLITYESLDAAVTRMKSESMLFLRNFFVRYLR